MSDNRYYLIKLLIIYFDRIFSAVNPVYIPKKWYFMSIFVFVVICLCVCISMVIMSVTVPVCTYLTHALSLKELNVQWLINNLCIRQNKILDQLLKNLLFLCLCVIYRAKYLWYCNGKVVEIERLRGKLLYRLTKHLFSIHRGLFLEFVSISAKVPMILVLVGDII